MTPDEQARHDAFLGNAFGLFKMAQALVTERSKSYNKSSPIQFNLGSPMETLNLLKLKVRRLESVLKEWNESVIKGDDTVLLDTLVDTAAYTAFIYAWVFEEEEKDGPEEVAGQSAH